MNWKGLILLLLTIMSLHSSALSCPEECECYHDINLYTANCSSFPISNENELAKIEVFNLSPMSSVPLALKEGQFVGYKKLKYLSLSNCSIYYIHKKAFYGLKNLIEIDLSFNDIHILDQLVFQHNNDLTSLILRGNPIKFTANRPFLISNTIQRLDLGLSSIKSIPRGVFFGVKKIMYMSLDGNRLQTLKYNSLPRGLIYLNIANNMMINVPIELLTSLTSLRRLDLSGNPINCTCPLMDLQDWFSGRGVTFDNEVICASPPQYAGRSWNEVNENELCITETLIDDMKKKPLKKVTKNEFKNKEKYDFSSDKNKYLETSALQADEPVRFTDDKMDPNAEVLFQNDDTLSMGEMMQEKELGKTEKPDDKLENDTDGGDKMENDTNGSEVANVEDASTKTAFDDIDSDDSILKEEENENKEDEAEPASVITSDNKQDTSKQHDTDNGSMLPSEDQLDILTEGKSDEQNLQNDEVNNADSAKTTDEKAADSPLTDGDKKETEEKIEPDSLPVPQTEEKNKKEPIPAEEHDDEYDKAASEALLTDDQLPKTDEKQNAVETNPTENTSDESKEKELIKNEGTNEDKLPEINVSEGKVENKEDSVADEKPQNEIKENISEIQNVKEEQILKEHESTKEEPLPENSENENRHPSHGSTLEEDLLEQERLIKTAGAGNEEEHTSDLESKGNVENKDKVAGENPQNEIKEETSKTENAKEEETAKEQGSTKEELMPENSESENKHSSHASILDEDLLVEEGLIKTAGAGNKEEYISDLDSTEEPAKNIDENNIDTGVIVDEGEKLKEKIGQIKAAQSVDEQDKIENSDLKPETESELTPSENLHTASEIGIDADKKDSVPLESSSNGTNDTEDKLDKSLSESESIAAVIDNTTEEKLEEPLFNNNDSVIIENNNVAKDESVAKSTEHDNVDPKNEAESVAVKKETETAAPHNSEGEEANVLVAVSSENKTKQESKVDEHSETESHLDSKTDEKLGNLIAVNNSSGEASEKEVETTVGPLDSKEVFKSKLNEEMFITDVSDEVFNTDSADYDTSTTQAPDVLISGEEPEKNKTYQTPDTKILSTINETQYNATNTTDVLEDIPDPTEDAETDETSVMSTVSEEVIIKQNANGVMVEPEVTSGPDVLMETTATVDTSVDDVTPGEILSENGPNIPLVSTSNKPNADVKEAVPNDEVRQEQEPFEFQEAHIVLACILVLVLALVLFSVYKCATNKNKSTKRITKDIESNHGTEMQDMASLLPKPSEDDNKSTKKYPEDASSNEKVKLITEDKEDDDNQYQRGNETQAVVEKENTLNNNAPNAPNKPTPVNRTATPNTINPAAPIQRTKVKVAIIPESIPRTPIFVQKTYNNGVSTNG